MGDRFTSLVFTCPCIANINPNHNRQDATFLILFISTDALYVSGGSSAYHQEHIRAIHTASGIVHVSKQLYWLTIPEAVCTVMCS